MTIPDAIDIVEALWKDLVQKQMPTYAEALGLGIAALRAVKDGRTDNYCAPIPLLPGETEE